MTTPIFETNRLILRPLAHTDAPRIQEQFSDYDTVRYMSASIPWPYPAGGATHFVRLMLEKVEKSHDHYWAVTLRSAGDNLLIGGIGLMPSSENYNRGFWMAREYQGKGMMKEAVVPVTDFAFRELGMECLVLNNAEPNFASHRLKELSGAKIIAVRENIRYVSGSFRAIRWRLTRQDWEENRHRFTGCEAYRIIETIPDENTTHVKGNY
jgi:RimJ/RimL family protein N-acetyltransferase